MQNDHDLIVVFSGNAWQAGMVKSLLEDAGLQAFLRDEIIGTMSPWWAAPGGAGSVKVMVAGYGTARAREVVEEYEKNSREQ
jgi:hypothetical protein